MLRRFLPLYAAWILCCAALFVLLRGAEDPSRRHGRILSNDAAAKAVEILQQRGMRNYEAVHVAYADEEWIVLCDQVPHTRLREAIVVELRADSGALLTIRRAKG